MTQLSAAEKAHVLKVTASVTESNGRAMVVESAAGVPIAAFFQPARKNDRNPNNVATVQFFDARFQITPRGQFISSYQAATVLKTQTANTALPLQIGRGDWDLAPVAFNAVKRWVLSCVADANAQDDLMRTSSDAPTADQLRARACELLMQASALDGLSPTLAQLLVPSSVSLVGSIPGGPVAKVQTSSTGPVDNLSEDGDDYVVTFEISITADSFENAAKFAVEDMMDTSLTDSFGFDLTVKNVESNRVQQLNVDHVNGEVSRTDGHEPTAMGAMGAMGAMDTLSAANRQGAGRGDRPFA